MKMVSFFHTVLHDQPFQLFNYVQRTSIAAQTEASQHLDRYKHLLLLLKTEIVVLNFISLTKVHIRSDIRSRIDIKSMSILESLYLSSN